MYLLIKAGLASKAELETVYTLDEALKLYALYRMDCDVEAYHAEKMKNSGNANSRRGRR
jgi:phosphodiesterase/alkaline phosphatase D-like protein